MLTTEQQSAFESIVISIYPDYEQCFDLNLIEYDDIGYKLTNEYNPYDESTNKYIAIRGNYIRNNVLICENNAASNHPVRKPYTLLSDVVEDINILLKCFILAYDKGVDEGFDNGYEYARYQYY